MKDQLRFKEDELKKSETTSMGLAGEHAKLQQDLQVNRIGLLGAQYLQNFDSLLMRSITEIRSTGRENSDGNVGAEREI